MEDRRRARYHSAAAKLIVYYLPAYVVVARWCSGKDVLVVGPADADGPSRLRAAGARMIVVRRKDEEFDQAGLRSGDFDVVDGVPQLPRDDQSVDLVVCLETYGTLADDERREFLEEARRVLRPDGMLIVWLEQDCGVVFGRKLQTPVAVDFWTMEAELTHRFSEVGLMAQIPWQGFAMAPVPGEADEPDPPVLAIDEGLLDDVPQASHYLAVGALGGLPPAVREQCLLVPVGDIADPGPSQAESDALNQRIEEVQREHEATLHDLEQMRGSLADATTELDRARDELEVRAARTADVQTRVRELEAQLEHLRTLDGGRQATEATVESLRAELASTKETLTRERTLQQETVARLEASQERIRTLDTDLAVLTKTLDEQERALARANETAESRTSELAERTRRMEEFSRRAEALDAEREELARQLDVAVAEREGIRQLAGRVEAELELTRKKVAAQEEQLASRIEESSRMKAEVAVLRKQLETQEHALAQTRSRAEELTASAAQGAEQGRVLADVAVDRDRLREELGKRSAEIRELEQRLWASREEIQRERLENVRNTAQLEALRERSQRSLDNEKAQTEEIERLNGELRHIDLERTELRGLLRARDEELQRLQRDLDSIESESQDLKTLRAQLTDRSHQIAELTGELERARARAQDARELAQRREQQLNQLNVELQRWREEAEGKAQSVSTIRHDLDASQLKVEQFSTQIGNLHDEVEQQRGRVAESEHMIADLQRRLEEGVSEQQLLRRQLREREHQLEEALAKAESSQLETEKLRADLEERSRDHEGPPPEAGQSQGAGASVVPISRVPVEWPAAAREQIEQLKHQLAAQARRHAEQLARQRQVVHDDRGRSRVRRIEREVEIRAEEQEVMLVRLDEAEQRIWEMTDESDRNAARLAASLAELDKNKDRLNETFEELEVTRNLLNAAQTRALEQERALGSERAKLARAGLDPGQNASSAEASVGVDRLFAELNPKRVGSVMDLAGDSPSRVSRLPTPASGGASRGKDERRRPGVLLEPVEAPGRASAHPGEDHGKRDEKPPGKNMSSGGAGDGS